jgi:hypothetical protein
LHKDPVDADGRRSVVVFFLFVVVEQKMTDIIFVVAVAFTAQIKCVIAVLLIPTNYCITKLNLNRPVNRIQAIIPLTGLGFGVFF